MRSWFRMVLVCSLLCLTGCGGCGPGEKDKNKLKDVPKASFVE